MVSARNQTSEYIRELTLERNPTNVINVEKLSVKNQALENIRKPIQRNKNINIMKMENSELKIKPHNTKYI